MNYVCLTMKATMNTEEHMFYQFILIFSKILVNLNFSHGDLCNTCLVMGSIVTALLGGLCFPMLSTPYLTAAAVSISIPLSIIFEIVPTTYSIFINKIFKVLLLYFRLYFKVMIMQYRN